MKQIKITLRKEKLFLSKLYIALLILFLLVGIAFIGLITLWILNDKSLLALEIKELILSLTPAAITIVLAAGGFISWVYNQNEKMKTKILEDTSHTNLAFDYSVFPTEIKYVIETQKPIYNVSVILKLNNTHYLLESFLSLEKEKKHELDLNLSSLYRDQGLSYKKAETASPEIIIIYRDANNGVFQIEGNKKYKVLPDQDGLFFIEKSSIDSAFKERVEIFIEIPAYKVAVKHILESDDIWILLKKTQEIIPKLINFHSLPWELDLSELDHKISFHYKERLYTYDNIGGFYPSDKLSGALDKAWNSFIKNDFLKRINEYLLLESKPIFLPMELDNFSLKDTSATEYIREKFVFRLTNYNQPKLIFSNGAFSGQDTRKSLYEIAGTIKNLTFSNTNLSFASCLYLEEIKNYIYKNINFLSNLSWDKLDEELREQANYSKYIDFYIKKEYIERVTHMRVDKKRIEKNVEELIYLASKFANKEGIRYKELQLFKQKASHNHWYEKDIFDYKKIRNIPVNQPICEFINSDVYNDEPYLHSLHPDKVCIHQIINLVRS